MIRTYHGCQIESTPAPHTVDDGEILCDGFSHAVRKNDQELGTFPTLALAIAAAKGAHGPYTYQPVVEE